MMFLIAVFSKWICLRSANVSEILHKQQNLLTTLILFKHEFSDKKEARE